MYKESPDRRVVTAPAGWRRRTFIKAVIGCAGALLAGGSIGSAEAARRGYSGPGRPDGNQTYIGWIVTRTSDGNFEVAPDPTPLRVTFQNEGADFYDCAVDAASVQFIEHARIFPGQPKVISVPAHDAYLISSWDTHGDPIFGVSLPL
jgi:hypothetical protein